MNNKGLFTRSNNIAIFLLCMLFLVGCVQKEAVENSDQAVQGSNAEIEKINQTQETIPEEMQDTSSEVSPTEPESPASTLPEPAPVEVVEVQKPLTFEEQVWKRRIDAAMAPSYCPPVTKVVYPSSYYQGPLIDTHYHLPSLPDSLPGEEEGEEEMYRQYYGRNYVYEDDEDDEEEEEDEEPYLGKDIKISEIACILQHEGTTRNFALFPIYSEISPHALEIAKRAKEQYPNLFTPFMQDTTLEDTTSLKSEVLNEKIHVAYPGLFQGWGEISLYVQKDGSGRYLPPDSPLFTEIYHIIRKHQMMVWMHPGEDMEDNFECVLTQNQDINFIVHGDQIKDGISSLMSKYPNIYFCINDLYGDQLSYGDVDIFGHKNKESFFAVLENYEPLIQRDLRNWESIIEAHPDQVMWCLDRDQRVLWTFDRDVGLKLVDYARAFIGRLDPVVQEKFAYKNAERLINGD